MLFGFVIAVAVALVAAVAAWLFRRSRLRLLLMTAVLAAVGVWLGVIGIALTEWRDLDGAVDCWPHCSAEQNAMKVAFLASPLAALLFATASVASLLRR